jgi:transcriptional regulator GlxA family with amidase domain
VYIIHIDRVVDRDRIITTPLLKCGHSRQFVDDRMTGAYCIEDFGRKIERLGQRGRGADERMRAKRAKFVETADFDGETVSYDRPPVPELSVGIVLGPDFPLLSLAGFLDALRHASDYGDRSRKLRCAWSILGPHVGAIARSSCGVEVKGDEEFVDPSRFDYIGVIGGLLRSAAKMNPKANAYLRSAAAIGTPVIGICTGTFILAQEGLLDGGRAAVHPYHAVEFKQRFPRVGAVSNVDFIDDGNRLSCPGGISIISLATHLIARHCGQARAIKTVHQMTMSNKAATAKVPLFQAIGYTRVADPRLKRAVFLIDRNLPRPTSSEWLAGQVNISRRQLARLFRDEFDQSVAKYILSARMRYAKWLLQNSTETVTEVALLTGFSDCAHFVRQFRGAYSVSPGRFRSESKTGSTSAPGL